jgi:hypothetical protein
VDVLKEFETKVFYYIDVKEFSMKGVRSKIRSKPHYITELQLIFENSSRNTSFFVGCNTDLQGEVRNYIGDKWEYFTNFVFLT